jgi:hypothetical protein
MESTGDAPMRVDFSIRVVMDASSYSEVGNVMDEIAAKIRAVAIIAEQKLRFDFVDFQTRPCKAVRMEQIAYHNESRAQLDVAEPGLSRHDL